jgi:ribosomal protein S18 acetylase RimI-like enzyme
MTIRKVEEKDKEQLLNLHKIFHINFHHEELLQNSPILPIIKYADPKVSMKHAVDEMFDGSHISFIAEKDGEIIAFIGGKINELVYKVHNKEGYIDDWFVKETYRSKGIGKKLYDALTLEFKKLGCTHLAIGAYCENKQALDFYRKLGFFDFTVTLKKKID